MNDNMAHELIKKLHQQNELLKEALHKETIQEIVPPNYLSDYLSSGWKYVGSFSNGRDTFVVVEIDKKEQEVDMNSKQKAIEKIHYTLISHLENLSIMGNGWTKELNRISWNDGPETFDVREWDSQHTRFSRGAVLTDEQMNDLARSFTYWKDRGKTLEKRVAEGEKDSIIASGISIVFYGHVGSLGRVNERGWIKEMNICSWNNQTPMYDLRDWSPDHRTWMSSGVQFTEEELSLLCSAYFKYEQKRLAQDLFGDEEAV